MEGTGTFSLEVPNSPHRYTGTIVIDGWNKAQGTMQGPHGIAAETRHVNVGKSHIDVIFTSADSSKNGGVEVEYVSTSSVAALNQMARYLARTLRVASQSIRLSCPGSSNKREAGTGLFPS
jgi:hypothetical protein